jgi:hypothetical protein
MHLSTYVPTYFAIIPYTYPRKGYYELRGFKPGLLLYFSIGFFAIPHIYSKCLYQRMRWGQLIRDIDFMNMLAVERLGKRGPLYRSAEFEVVQ